jgi:hypothetical protein
MNPVRIRRKLDSETLHLPEIKPFIGKMVEISVEELAPEVRDEFWAEAARLPESPEALEAQKAKFRAWRADSRFEPYWPVLDDLLNRSFDHVRKWAAAAQAVRELKDYDFDAWRQLREYELKHANDHLP